jgi:hypothetical protein
MERRRKGNNMEEEVVYQITCKECEKIYIGNKKIQDKEVGWNNT